MGGRWGQFYHRWQPVLLVGMGILIALCGVYLYGFTRPADQHLTQKDIDNTVARAQASSALTPSLESQVYAIIQPSIVSIETQTPGTDQKPEQMSGTGVVIDDSGTILTCLHTVAKAFRIRVTYADGTESEASLISSRAENDMAVLHPEIIPDNLTPATLASSSRLTVGEKVVAVGNPFGINDSLTSGVVSGLERSFKSPDSGLELSDLIQFDAAVNPGNSGGPLVDRYGEVVGIVDALLNPTGQDVFIGIGFAVPIENAGAALGTPWY